MLTRLGHIPRSGETIDYDGRRLTVVEMESRRIAKIQVQPIEKAQDSVAELPAS
jgi:CBS domain containing-hemolysin-like protein